MKKIIETTVLLTIISLCSCNDSVYSESNNNEYININLIVENDNNSRANINDDGSGDFVKGDKIGLYSTDGNVSRHFILEYNGKNWHPNITHDDLLFNSLNFSTLAAYYPANESLGHNVIINKVFHDIELKTDQSLEADFNSQDLLFDTQNINSSGKDISFSLKHRMLRLNIDVQDIKSNILEVRVDAAHKGEFEIAKLIDNSNIKTSNEAHKSFIPYKKNNNIYSVYTLPQVKSKYGTNTKREIKIELTSNDKSQTFIINEDKLNDNLWNGGNITIKLSSDSNTIIDEKYANRKIWFYGIEGNTPVCPEGDWKPAFNDEEVMKLEYKPEYGWFDCNKRYPLDGKTGDNYQCWAAVSSNIIHWWFKHNAPYSYQYRNWYNDSIKNIKLAPGETPPDTIPSPEFKPLLWNRDETGTVGGSEIFKYFTKNFNDGGGFTHDGIDWFFLGSLITMPNIPKEGTGGFFRNVYGDKGLAWYTGGISKKIFNQTIKHAIENNEVVGYSINGHILNMWGVEFDENGYVSHAYICDNNYGDQDASFYNGASCTRTRITYKDNETYIGNYGQRSITRMTLMGLNSEKLINFVNNNCK